MSTSAKRDRTERLLRLEHLLYHHPGGLTAKEVADRNGVHPRTAYRDLKALQEELLLPVWEEKPRFGLLAGAFLPPLNLTLPEAVALFVSARLAARFSDRRHEHVIRAYGSLASVLPPVIARHIYSTLPAFNERPRDDRYTQVFGCLVEAWASGRKARITYVHHDADGRALMTDREIAPYVIEPHPAGHSMYVMAHDSLSQALRTFKIEPVQSAALTKTPSTCLLISIPRSGSAIPGSWPTSR